jgi:SAM-dependent methyltransferase
MREDNAQQMADWNGPTGERWLANQVRLDHMLEAFGNAAVEAVKPAEAEHGLDVGCGAGASSLAIARRVGEHGRVLGVDISAPLLDRARASVSVDTPVTFLQADASKAILPECEFDFLFSRFGVMFFDDPVAAFAHLRGALKPGGRLGFICWRAADENEWIRLPLEAVDGIVPRTAPPAPGAPGPLSFSDRERVSRILTSAGFHDIAFKAFDHDMSFGEAGTRKEAIDLAVAMVLEIGVLARTLDQQSEDLRMRASAALRDAFAHRSGERSVRLGGAAWIVTARNPTGREQYGAR